MPILPCRQTDYDGKSRRTAELIGELAESMTESRLRVLHLVRSEIPDIRRSRRRTCTTKVEKILVLKKRADTIHAVDREPIAVADAPAHKPTQRRRTRRSLDERGIKMSPKFPELTQETSVVAAAPNVFEGGPRES